MPATNRKSERNGCQNRRTARKTYLSRQFFFSARSQTNVCTTFNFYQTTIEYGTVSDVS